jgi:hypothetical protein
MTMHREGHVFKNHWAWVLMMSAMLVGSQLGVGLAAGGWGIGLETAESAAAKASASGKRTLAQTPAGQPASEDAGSSTSFVGKRDPFNVPPPPREAKEEDSMGPLPPGKRGLVIGQLKLQGVVRDNANKNIIAVVTNQTKRAYFLRVHDDVYNGVVGEITADSIHFRENRLDHNGRLETQEVVLKLGAHSREGR